MWWLLLVGCVEYELVDGGEPVWTGHHGTELEPRVQEDRIVLALPPEVDVLWVFDTSCSMDVEREALMFSIPEFLEPILSSGLDFHVGLVSTDVHDPARRGLLAGPAAQPWLDSSARDPEGAFEDMLFELGRNGANPECGLGATWLALSEHAPAPNAGFRREGVPLHTVVVSDEPDQTPEQALPPEGFVPWYAATAAGGTFNGITLPGALSGVIGDLGGLEWPIGVRPWDQPIGELGTGVVGTSGLYVLSALPDVDTIEVTVHRDGVTTAPGPDEWSYDEVTNGIVFVERPPARSEVRVRYVLRAGL